MLVGGDGTFEMTDGNITGNTAIYGGGVYSGVNVYGVKFKMTGGNISGNTATSGGGVCAYNCLFEISGAPIITGNVFIDGDHGTESASNVYLIEGATITVAGALKAGAIIGIHNSGEVVTGFTTENNPDGKKPSEFFIPDNDYFDCIYATDSGAVSIGKHTGGTAVRENEVTATCSKEGSYDEVVSCSGCGEELSRTQKPITINPNAHNFGQWQDEIPASCTTEGTKGYKDCTLCHKHFDSENAEIADLTIQTNDNHRWDNGTVIKEPNCTEAGVITFTCVYNSAHTKTENIAALGHEYGEWIVTKAATCTEGGSRYRVCAHNDEHIEEEDIEALGHDYGDWVTTKLPSGFQDGEQRRFCSHDSSHVEIRILDKYFDLDELRPSTPSDSNNTNQKKEQKLQMDLIVLIVLLALIIAGEIAFLIYRKTRKGRITSKASRTKTRLRKNKSEIDDDGGNVKW